MKNKQIVILVLAFFAMQSWAQDSKQTFTRKVVLEQFTTGACQYCPIGTEHIQNAVDNANNLIWIKYHAGFGTDNLTNEVATAYLAFYGGSTYAPALMVDRTRFDTSKPGPVTGVGQASEIRRWVGQAREVETTCKVYTPEVAYNADTRHLSGVVEGRFGDESFGPNTRINVYVVEDSIYMYQSDAYGVSGNIYHLDAVRAAITDIWGDPLTVEGSNHNFSYTIDYTLPEDFVYKNCRIVALVTNYDEGDINNRKVLNGAESDYLNKLLSIGETDAGCQMRVYPNPASNRLFVQADHSIKSVVMLNSLGQVVRQQQGVDKTVVVELGDLAKGVYLVKVLTDAGMATRQVVVR
jgi:hypothetical protein